MTDSASTSTTSAPHPAEGTEVINLRDFPHSGLRKGTVGKVVDSTSSDTFVEVDFPEHKNFLMLPSEYETWRWNIGDTVRSKEDKRVVFTIVGREISITNNGVYQFYKTEATGKWFLDHNRFELATEETPPSDQRPPAGTKITLLRNFHHNGLTKGAVGTVLELQPGSIFTRATFPGGVAMPLLAKEFTVLPASEPEEEETWRWNIGDKVAWKMGAQGVGRQKTSVAYYTVKSRRRSMQGKERYRVEENDFEWNLRHEEFRLVTSEPPTKEEAVKPWPIVEAEAAKEPIMGWGFSATYAELDQTRLFREMDEAGFDFAVVRLPKPDGTTRQVGFLRGTFGIAALEADPHSSYTRMPAGLKATNLSACNKWLRIEREDGGPVTMADLDAWAATIRWCQRKHAYRVDGGRI